MVYKSIFSIVFIILIITSCNHQDYKQGEALFELHCVACHQKNGEGLAKLYPPVANSDFWKNNKEDLACIIRYGLKDTIVVNGQEYSMPMAALPNLTEYEITNIINYIDYQFYKKDTPTNITEIRKQLENCDRK